MCEWTRERELLKNFLRILSEWFPKHLESSCPQGHVGSNPTHSARKSLKHNASRTSIFPEDFSIPIVSSKMVPMVPRFVVPGQ